MWLLRGMGFSFRVIGDRFGVTPTRVMRLVRRADGLIKSGSLTPPDRPVVPAPKPKPRPPVETRLKTRLRGDETFSSAYPWRYAPCSCRPFYQGDTVPIGVFIVPGGTAPARILRCLRCDAHWWYSADDIAAQEAIDATS